jgi:phenylacetate-coenzyme A ligase PaaK-like adenylate-forming protein
MSDSLLQLYHRLPPTLRSVAASLQGLYLRHWRYGPNSERLAGEALAREYWSQGQWKIWQEERLAYVLHRAATQVPYYRTHWATRRRRGDRASWQYLENWPVLKKEAVRRYPTAFVADDCNIRHMYRESTSGTTGTPLDLRWSRSTLRAWFALYEARNRIWNGVCRHENWAILGGQPVVPGDTRQPPFWVWNASMNQLYLSANHISRENVPLYFEAMARYCVTHLVTYSSSASFLARQALDLGLSTIGLKVIIANSEPLFPWQRETIYQGLRSEVREFYGMAEAVAAASECSAGTLHLWPEVGWLEVLSDAEDVHVPRGTSGRLVCTGLLNVDMPLVRYEVGDRGKLGAERMICKCGRTLSIISSIEGRTNDLLITRDGRRVYWLNPIFYGLPLREAQIIQEGLDRVRILYVHAPEFTPEDAHSIIERLRKRMGNVEVILEPVKEISRSANGKFQAVICNLRPEQREPIRRLENKVVIPE